MNDCTNCRFWHGDAKTEMHCIFNNTKPGRVKICPDWAKEYINLETDKWDKEDTK